LSAAGRGIVSENFVANWLEDEGWTVASRRHRRGGGDLVAIHPIKGHIWLIEVKLCPTRGAVFSGGYFSREQRQEMRETPMPGYAVRYLARVHGPTKERQIEWVVESEWPCAK